MVMIMTGQFLMLDHFGPVEYGPGEAVGAPDHPHRGFETVTYMLQGTFEHKDSWGNEGRLGPGWVQWMTAGSGLVHSEMPSKEIIEKGGVVEGFQLWVNLPAKDKMIPPRYQDTPAETIPIVRIPGAASDASTVKVVAGESCGVSAVIETKIPITYLDITLQPGDRLEQPCPRSRHAFAYVFRSRVTVGSNRKSAMEGQVVEIDHDGDVFTVEAPADNTEAARVLFIAGEPIGEPVAQYGPFVMNTREEIMQAMRDFQAGKMGAIAGEEERMRETRAARATQKRTGRWDHDEEL